MIDQFILFYRDNITNDEIQLTVHIAEANEIYCPFQTESIDTFVRVYLVPDLLIAQQTKVTTN